MNISKKYTNISSVPKKTSEKENLKLHPEITVNSLPFSDSKIEKSYTDKMSMMSVQIASIEDTLSNFTCLIKLLQSCANSHEQEARQYNERQEQERQKLESRITVLERRLIDQEKANTLRKEEQTSKMLLAEQSLRELELHFDSLIENKFKKIESKVEKGEEPLKKQWDETTQKLQESNQQQSELLGAWKQSIEEQLQSLKIFTSSKVEAAEVSRVLCMLEEEIDRRELGDTKLSETVNNMEESLKKLMIQFMNPQKPNMEPTDWKKTVGEYRQGGDNLKSFEKSITKKFQRGMENIQKIVEKSSSVAKSSTSLFPEHSKQTEESKYSELQKEIDEKCIVTISETENNGEEILQSFISKPLALPKPIDPGPIRSTRSKSATRCAPAVYRSLRPELKQFPDFFQTSRQFSHQESQCTNTFLSRCEKKFDGLMAKFTKNA